MNGKTLLGIGLGLGAYWASRQPGGIKGTWNRLQQGFRDVQAGQNPMEVGKRFVSGGSEEPAGAYQRDFATAEERGTFDAPYEDFVAGGHPGR